MDSESLKEFAPAVTVLAGVVTAIAAIWSTPVQENTKITSSILVLIVLLYFYFSVNFVKKTEFKKLKEEFEKYSKK